LIERRTSLGSLTFIHIAFDILVVMHWLIGELICEQFKNGSGIDRSK
jgi:hypothetical protein